MSETKSDPVTAADAAIKQSARETPSPSKAGQGAKFFAGGAALGAGALAAASWVKGNQPLKPDTPITQPHSVTDTTRKSSPSDSVKAQITSPDQAFDTEQLADNAQLKEQFDQAAQLMAQLRETHSQIQNDLQQLQALRSSILDAHAKLADIEAEINLLPQSGETEISSEEDSSYQDDSNQDDGNQFYA